MCTTETALYELAARLIQLSGHEKTALELVLGTELRTQEQLALVLDQYTQLLAIERDYFIALLTTD